MEVNGFTQIRDRVDNREWFDTAFMMINSNRKCQKLFDQILPLMPSKSNIFTRNTLILHLFIEFQSSNSQHVWTNLQDSLSHDVVMIPQSALVNDFCAHFKAACERYFYTNFATEQQKQDHAVVQHNKHKRAKTERYKKWLNMDTKASFEKVEAARVKFERRLVAWTFIINDMDLMETAIINTTAERWEADFEAEMLRTCGRHGKVILPTTRNLAEKLVEPGQTDFQFIQ